ncbi:GNAT family N-acetyltransferase [Streptomyces sp. NPDC058572]|uniref:GNAT family N-acetyltransferase n=1 Tax=Streptomyces sp. NPDC058572 TaxID=3346546 RepID=UPI0036656C6B
MTIWTFASNSNDEKIAVECNGGEFKITSESNAYTGTLSYDLTGSSLDCPCIHNIWVDPEGAGLGSVLMWCFATSMNSTFLALTLPAPEAYGWYEKLGFIPDPAAYYSIGGDFSEQEAKALAKAFPMVADRSGVEEISFFSCSNKWKLLGVE